METDTDALVYFYRNAMEDATSPDKMTVANALYFWEEIMDLADEWIRNLELDRAKSEKASEEEV